MNGLKKKKKKMRDIKFRYVYQHKENKNRIYILSISLEDLETTHLSIRRNEETKSLTNEDEWNLISIDEYTGLKDKNDKDIYENDIIRTYIEDDCVNTKVFFASGGFCIESKVGEYDYAPYLGEFYDLRFLKIIGNVYENSELLE